MPLLLTVKAASVVGTVTTWSLTVPGNQLWYPRSFVAVASTTVGGSPNRAYTLGITDGSNLVAKVGAADAGTEPATVTVTWANVPSAASTSGNIGTTVAPLPALILKPGYVITGTIINSHAGDTWASALCWYDYIDT